MGGDDSQKLLPWRGIHSSSGRRKPRFDYRINHSNAKMSADFTYDEMIG
jgi:hypothetical protein